MEEESPGQWQARQVVGVIGRCPVDGRAGKRSGCFALRGVSRFRPSEDRQHPWVRGGGKDRKDNNTNTLTLTLSIPPLRHSRRPVIHQSGNSAFSYKFVFLIMKEKRMEKKKKVKRACKSAEWWQRRKT